MNIAMSVDVVLPVIGQRAMLYIRNEVQGECDKIQRRSVELSSRLWVIGASEGCHSCAVFAFWCSVDQTMQDVLWAHFPPFTSSLCMPRVSGWRETNDQVSGNECRPID